MSSAQHVLALLKSYVEGNDEEFFAVAMQVASREARSGHVKVAQAVRELVDAGKSRRSTSVLGPSSSPGRPGRDAVVPVARPSGDLATLLTASYAETRLADMVLPTPVRARLERVLLEQRQQEELKAHGLQPRRKLLLLGPPGSGKTMTAAAIAGDLKIPLLTIRLDGVITRYMGESASKLRLIFDAMVSTRGVYLFDEFDAIGSRRSATNDVGEIRRVLNSFLQFLEQDSSASVVVAATNHPELLDPALFRRFDDVLQYTMPDQDMTVALLQCRLAMFQAKRVNWNAAAKAATGLSHADIARAAEEAAKAAILSGHKQVTTASLVAALEERRPAQMEGL